MKKTSHKEAGIAMSRKIIPVVLFALGVHAHAQESVSSLKLTSPYNTPGRGYSLMGTATLSVNVNDPSSVDHVSFVVDGSPVKTVWQFPYSCQWEDSRTSPGLHQLEVIVTRKTGQTEDCLQMFTAEPFEKLHPTGNKASVNVLPVIQDNHTGIFYKLDPSANEHADEHTEGLTLWKSTDKAQWEYVGLVWSFEGDATSEQRQWGKAGLTDIRKINHASLIFTNDNFYIRAVFEHGKLADLLKSSTGRAEGPYISATAVEAQVIKSMPVNEILGQKDMTISAYPNPASTAFKITMPALGNYTYLIKDLGQHTVETGRLENEALVGNKLTAGYYTITVTDLEGNTSFIKLLKQ